MTRVRIPLILRMVKGVVVDIRSDREDTPSTFQVFCSSFKDCLSPLSIPGGHPFGGGQFKFHFN